MNKILPCQLSDQNLKSCLLNQFAQESCVSLLQVWALLNKHPASSGCPTLQRTNPFHWFHTDMPGWPAEPRQRPVVLDAALTAFSHSSALTGPANCLVLPLQSKPALTRLLPALTGSSGSRQHTCCVSGPQSTVNITTVACGGPR